MKFPGSTEDHVDSKAAEYPSSLLNRVSDAERIQDLASRAQGPGIPAAS